MTLATARPVRLGSREHRLMRRAESERVKGLIHEFEKLVAEARLLARHKDGLIEPTLEASRLAVLDALFGFIDGQVPLGELQAIAAPLQAEISRESAQEMLDWLRSTLPLH